MILGDGGIRQENNFMGGIAISQLGDMANSASSVILQGRANTYYDNKIYVKAETSSYGDQGLQSLNIKTGSWCALTGYDDNKTIYGFDTIGNKLYTTYSQKVSGTTTIDIVPYTPLTDTWGTKQSFTHSYNQDTRACSYGNYIYIAYEYSNTSGNYLWHLKRFNTSSSTVSNDLNFEVYMASGYTSTVDIQSTNDAIYFTSGSYIYKYHPPSDTTSIAFSGYIFSNPGYDFIMKIGNNLYFQYYYTDASLIRIWRANTTASVIGSGSFININKRMDMGVSDNNKYLYLFGGIQPLSPYTPTFGETYRVTIE
jgi:hypothetical protein